MPPAHSQISDRIIAFQSNVWAAVNIHGARDDRERFEEAFRLLEKFKAEA